MTDISADLTLADKLQAQTDIRAILQEQDPTLDLSIGGPVDSLLVNGNAIVVGQNNSQVDRAYLYQQLKAISEGTVTISDEDMDQLMSNYFLVRQEDVLAYGEVVFVVQSNRPYTFTSGYRLTANNKFYQLTETYSVYPVGTTGVDFSIPTNVEIENVYDLETGYSYRFRLPLQAVEAGPTSILVSGDRLVPSQSFVGLGYVQASTNFRGGTVKETNQEFATRGLTGYLAETVGGEENIDKLVGQAYPLARSNSIGAGDVLMTRDRNNVFNLPTGGKVDVYVKSGAVASSSFLVEAEVVDFVTQTAKITLTREQSAGVYLQDVIAYFTSTPPAGITGTIQILSVSHLAWTDPDGGFNPVMPADIDRAFSAHQQIEITFKDDRLLPSLVPVVPMTYNGEALTDSYAVTTTYQPGVLESATYLLSDAVRPPGVDVLVKAAVPCITTVIVVASKPAAYNGPDASTLSSLVSSEINQLDVGLEALDTYTISALIKQASASLTVVSVALTGTVIAQDGTQIPIFQAGQQLIIPTDATKKVSPDNAYFSTTYLSVEVTLV